MRDRFYVSRVSLSLYPSIYPTSTRPHTRCTRRAVVKANSRACGGHPRQTSLRHPFMPLARGAYGNSENKWTDNAAVSDEGRSAAAFKLAGTNEQAECAADRAGAKEVETPRLRGGASAIAPFRSARVMRNDRRLTTWLRGSLFFN